MSSPDTLTVVLDYAARDWPVFPIKPQSKEPATKRGFYDATTNPATLRRWFARGFPYNVAVRTGQPSGVFILDIDGELGASNLCALVAEHGPLPATRISTTGKGHHLWFRADCEIPCSTRKIAPGVDVRADGGYVVAPPSLHPNGAVYRWANNLAPSPAPSWLLSLAQQAKASPTLPPLPPPRLLPSRSSSRAAAEDRYGKAALEREIEALSQVAKGGRNAALNFASFRLYQLVAGGELDGAEVERELVAAATANGLMIDPEDGPRRVMATIISGANAGMRFPRDRHGRR
jgi:hypothetical protein